MWPFNTALPLRVCENCFGTYSTGKSYEDFWCQVTNKDVQVKGLCPFCNPTSKYYNK